MVTVPHLSSLLQKSEEQSLLFRQSSPSASTPHLSIPLQLLEVQSLFLLHDSPSASCQRRQGQQRYSGGEKGSPCRTGRNYCIRSTYSRCCARKRLRLLVFHRYPAYCRIRSCRCCGISYAPTHSYHKARHQRPGVHTIRAMEKEQNEHRPTLVELIAEI